MRLSARGFVGVVGLWLCASLAHAQQVKPYFLIIFDTSGSMNDQAPANSCGYQTTTSNNQGSTTAPRKMDAAKCALGRLISATGDAEFGLMQFAQSNSCGNGTTCGPTTASAQMRVPIQTNTAGGILSLIDKAGNAPGQELCAGGYTPLGGTLAAAKVYYESGFQGYVAPTTADTGLACRPLSVILLTDGVECCDECDASQAAYNTGCPKAAATLTAAGKGSCPSGANACGTWGGCGNNNNLDAFETAPERAYELLTESTVPSAAGPTSKAIRTYVIGFGITQEDARIERIATAGGTDNPVDGTGGTRGFYASDETSLALAFSQIINDAQPPPEVCNNADDDCDGKIDEGLPKFCNKPAGIEDATLCDEPDETLCDGEDDDCDGFVDEGLRNACGQCESPPETCDGIDNDCDGKIDEDTDTGTCGTDVGSCETGTLRCIAGSEQCEGEVGPQPESCNCQDDDCDGTVDEDVDNSLCGQDEVCTGCMCVPRCNTAVEFMPTCDLGRRPDIQENGECLCVIDNCDANECRKSSLKRDGEVACDPDDPKVAPCICRAGECVARCDGIACADGMICDPRSGRCVEDNCRGLGCDKGELCDPDTAECIADPCADVECQDDEVCREGKCEKSCASVSCGAGKKCEHGKCTDNLCSNPNCGDGRVCDEKTGDCVDDMCVGTVCESGLACVPTSGDCERDPCFGVRCPSGQHCKAGECEKDGEPIAGSSGPTSSSNEDAVRVLAKGGGGCNCATAPGAGGGGRQPLALLTLGLLVTLWRGRRRRGGNGGPDGQGGRQRATRASRKHALWLLLGLSLLALGAAGCKVTPFCLDCVGASVAGHDGGGGGGSSGTGQSGSGGSGGSHEGDGGVLPDGGEVPDGAVLDDSGLPVCEDKQAEVCDGKDNDCDFRVDEDVEPDVNDCNQLGVCAGTEPICLNGEFSCRYPDTHQDDETLCDGLDNDCDGRVDEAFPDLGKSCEMGVGECTVQGTQVCADNQKMLRCEISGTKDPGEEICDGLDNDCDGLVDEPQSNPGSNPSYVHDDVVKVSGSLWVYAYEASRPDASDSAQGLTGERACSKPGVLPWTNVTYDEAKAACEAADMELCTVNQWLSACQGSMTCAYSYTASGTGPCLTGNASLPNRGCNGHDTSLGVGEADTDALAPTGSFNRCFTQNSGGPVYDLSGNAKEWTTGSESPDKNPLRGGSYNNQPDGLRCDFDFAVARPEVRVGNLGFRCCSTSAP